MGKAPLATVVLGAAIAALVGIAVLTGWPSDSTVAASPAAAVEGQLLWARVFGVAQAVAFVLFLLSLLLVRRRAPSTKVVLGIAVAIQLLPLAGPMLLSGDGWSYWNAGRIATVLAGDPYLDVPADFRADLSTSFVFPAWRELVTPYGPAWVGLSGAVALVSGPDASLATWLFRATAAAAMVIITVMVSKGSPRPALAAVFVGWNPVFAMQFAGSGHNDAVMAALVIAGLLAARHGRHRLGGLSWALAASVKWLPLVLLPLQLAEDLARRGRSLAMWTLVSFASLSVIATLAFGGSWAGAMAPLAENATQGVRSLAVWPRLAGYLPGVLVQLAPLVLLGAAYLLLMWQAWRGTTRRGLAVALLLLASPLLWPWYLITPSALAAYEDDGLAMWLCAAMVVYAGLLYLGDAGSVLDVYL